MSDKDLGVKLENEDVKCPSCKKQLNAATTISQSVNVVPEKGDLSICVYCGTILEFEDGGLVHKIETSKLLEIRKYDPRGHRILLEGRRLILERNRSRN